MSTQSRPRETGVTQDLTLSVTPLSKESTCSKLLKRSLREPCLRNTRFPNPRLRNPRLRDPHFRDPCLSHPSLRDPASSTPTSSIPASSTSARPAPEISTPAYPPLASSTVSGLTYIMRWFISTTHFLHSLFQQHSSPLFCKHNLFLHPLRKGSCIARRVN